MYKRILIALDGSEMAEQALPKAVAQAARFGAELILLLVLEPLPRTGLLLQDDVDRAERKASALAWDYLEGLGASIQDPAVAVKPAVIQGQASPSIVRYAETEGVDLIVICTRGRSGLSRWLMGSVADRVVRGATVPVLLVRAEQNKEWPCPPAVGQLLTSVPSKRQAAARVEITGDADDSFADRDSG